MLIQDRITREEFQAIFINGIRYYISCKKIPTSSRYSTIRYKFQREKHPSRRIHDFSFYSHDSCKVENLRSLRTDQSISRIVSQPFSSFCCRQPFRYFSRVRLKKGKTRVPNGESVCSFWNRIFIDKRGSIEAEDKSVSETVYAIKNPRITRGEGGNREISIYR